MSTLLATPVSARDHILGSANAPLTLVEYGDYECPYCGRAYPIVKSIQRRLGDQLRFVYRHFPLTQIHPYAEHAAEMAEAAGQYGKFWRMHDLLFTNQDQLADEALVGYAAQVGNDPQWAASALASRTFAPRVREHFMSGVRSGVNGTPTFFLNGVRHDGAWDEPHLLEALQLAAFAVGRR